VSHALPFSTATCPAILNVPHALPFSLCHMPRHFQRATCPAIFILDLVTRIMLRHLISSLPGLPEPS
jgi:hypothetical protein